MRDSIKSILRSWIPTIAIIIGITFLSIVRISPPGYILTSVDLLNHFIAYFVLSIVLHFPIRDRTRLNHVVRAVIIVLLCSFYGGLMEIVQSFLPVRECDIHDALANTYGAITGQVVAYVIERFKGKT